MRTTLVDWSFPSILRASELLVGHVECVEQDSTIRIMVGARLGPLNGRVGCQMVDHRAVFGRSGTQNSALIASRSLVISPRSTKVGSFDRAESARSN